MLNMEGALTSYQSFLEKGSTLKKKKMEIFTFTDIDVYICVCEHTHIRHGFLGEWHSRGSTPMIAENAQNTFSAQVCAPTLV